MFFLVVSAVLSTILLFLFRYAQTVESRLAHILSTAKFAVPLILIAEAVLVGTMIVPFHMVSVGHSQLQSHRDIGVVAAIQGRSAVGYLVSLDFWPPKNNSGGAQNSLTWRQRCNETSPFVVHTIVKLVRNRVRWRPIRRAVFGIKTSRCQHGTAF